MKCRAIKLVKANRKIQKANSVRKWLTVDEKQALDEKLKADPDVRELLLYQDKIRRLEKAKANFAKSYAKYQESSKEDTKEKG